MNLKIAWISVAVFVAAGAASAEPWRSQARAAGLSDADIAVLEEQGFLITNEAFKQIFTPYLLDVRPFFITTDSLINAYHVLYAESIYEMERRMAARLPDILRLLLDRMGLPHEAAPADRALVKAAEQRARLVAGVALRLLNDGFWLQEEVLNDLLEQEVNKIKAAEVVELPEWLGPEDENVVALDYSRYKPRGFYTRSEPLQQYFRAVAWLQSIPFRLDRPEELLAILMLGKALSSPNGEEEDIIRDARNMLGAYSSFVGAHDDWDLVFASDRARNTAPMPSLADYLESKQRSLTQLAEQDQDRFLISDQVRYAPADPERFAPPGFHVISAHQTPCAILFQRTTDLRRFERPFPSGLELCIALGSDVARDHLADSRKEELLEEIEANRHHFQGDSLYQRYFNALGVLLAPPDQKAPEFMKREPWRLKTINTVLGGWAQLRNTWILQAKSNLECLGFTMLPEGFVEPQPKFYSLMADLAATTRKRLQSAGTFEREYSRAITGLEELRQVLQTSSDDLEAKRLLLQNTLIANQIEWFAWGVPLARKEAEFTAFVESLTRHVDIALEFVRAGQMPLDPEAAELVHPFHTDLEKLWNRLEEVCQRLEEIAYRQLRQLPLDRWQADFIQNYGATLAQLMLYEGYTFNYAWDDAPKVADVFYNPPLGAYLHIGVARPRKMYVLYPWRDRLVLCAGGVMPYYEFVHGERLSDASWKALLDSANRPAIPAWFSGVVSGGALHAMVPGTLQ